VEDEKVGTTTIRNFLALFLSLAFLHASAEAPGIRGTPWERVLSIPRGEMAREAKHDLDYPSTRIFQATLSILQDGSLLLEENNGVLVLTMQTDGTWEATKPEQLAMHPLAPTIPDLVPDLFKQSVWTKRVSWRYTLYGQIDDPEFPESCFSRFDDEMSKDGYYWEEDEDVIGSWSCMEIEEKKKFFRKRYSSMERVYLERSEVNWSSSSGFFVGIQGFTFDDPGMGTNQYPLGSPALIRATHIMPNPILLYFGTADGKPWFVFDSFLLQGIDTSFDLHFAGVSQGYLVLNASRRLFLFDPSKHEFLSLLIPLDYGPFASDIQVCCNGTKIYAFGGSNSGSAEEKKPGGFVLYRTTASSLLEEYPDYPETRIDQ
jgi:hypothetical protein